MKRSFFLIALLLFVISSCKKERTCSCRIESRGTKTVHNQSASVTVTLNLIPGIPIPPVELVPAKDETSSNDYFFITTEKTSYDKIKKGVMKKLCQPDFSEDVFDSDVNVIPGTSTVTTTDQGKKNYTCKIE
jgi:hypothetical protein